MKTTSILPAILLSCAGLTLSSMALAAPNDGLPTEQVQGEVHFLTGGIGQSQSDAIQAVEHQYPLSLEFVQAATPRAEWTADVHVTIRGAAGQIVLDTNSDGPFLLARLPAGRYTVEASKHGVMKSDPIEIAADKPVHRVFEWS